jgi:hypothetical protein
MKDSKSILIVFTLGLLFSILFYHEWLGLNAALYELACFVALFFTGKLHFENKLLRFSLISQGITLLSLLYNYSAIAILVHLLFIILTIGILVYPTVKSSFYAILFAFYTMLSAPFQLFLKLISSLKYTKLNKNIIGKYKYYTIPLIIIIIFIVIYRNANPQFNQLILPIEAFLIQYIPNIFQYINEDFFVLFILGLIFSSFLFIQSVFRFLVPEEQNSTENITRTRLQNSTDLSMLSLKKELRAGVFLLIALNLLLLLVNGFDIYWVWFNFTWNGEFLKQFVHEGTYLLILSILLSAVIVIYYFRRNQNFYEKSKTLRTLSYLWIAQNIILCISVGIRNYWYIDYFNLAYKRIGVFAFLLLVVYGLYTIYLKVKNHHSNYYLLRKNSFSFFLVLLIMSLFNWDVIITKYNFKHASSAFVHFDYLADMSPKALPYMDYSLDELKAIEAKQNLLIVNRGVYMSAEEFHKALQNKKRYFIAEYAKKGWLSWNYADQRLVRQLLLEK